MSRFKFRQPLKQLGLFELGNYPLSLPTPPPDDDPAWDDRHDDMALAADDAQDAATHAGDIADDDVQGTVDAWLRMIARRRSVLFGGAVRCPMPIDYKLRPPEWKTLSLHLRTHRAGWRCEWCGAEQGKHHPVTGSRVVLTVAHLGIAKPDGTPGDKYDVYDNRPENLAVLCQRCHLNYDRNDAIRTKRRKRIERQIAAGQLRLIK